MTSAEDVLNNFFQVENEFYDLSDENRKTIIIDIGKHLKDSSIKELTEQQLSNLVKLANFNDGRDEENVWNYIAGCNGNTIASQLHKKLNITRMINVWAKANNFELANGPKAKETK